MKSGDSFGSCLTDRAACAGIVLAYADVWLEAGLEERWLARRVNLDASSTALAAEKSYREAACALGHDETTENGAAHPLWIAEQRGYDKRIEELTRLDDQFAGVTLHEGESSECRKSDVTRPFVRKYMEEKAAAEQEVVARRKLVCAFVRSRSCAWVSCS